MTEKSTQKVGCDSMDDKSKPIQRGKPPHKTTNKKNKNIMNEK